MSRDSNLVKLYPRIAELKVRVYRNPMHHVKRKELTSALGDKQAKFNKLFGIQTCFVEGPDAHDVEAVLERMASGKLVGSQLHWD